jgi:hypothetical protein
MDVGAAGVPGKRQGWCTASYRRRTTPRLPTWGVLV